MDDIVEKARAFAREAHKNQVRKYSGLPYFTHCEEVAEIVAAYDGTEAMIAAAYLHDVVEDTEVTIREIETKFGIEVSVLVSWLTDVSRPGDGKRKYRKEMDRQHLAAANPDAQTIKCCDILSNSKDIVVNDPNFARVYLREMVALLGVLKDANPDLHQVTSDFVNLACEEMGLRK